MPRFWLILIVSISLTIVSVVVWAVAGYWTWTETDPGPAAVLRGWAIDVTAISAVCWVAYALLRRIDARERCLIEEFRHREAILVKTLGQLARTATGPHRKLRGLP